MLVEDGAEGKTIREGRSEVLDVDILVSRRRVLHPLRDERLIDFTKMHAKMCMNRSDLKKGVLGRDLLVLVVAELEISHH